MTTNRSPRRIVKEALSTAAYLAFCEVAELVSEAPWLRSRPLMAEEITYTAIREWASQYVESLSEIWPTAEAIADLNAWEHEQWLAGAEKRSAAHQTGRRKARARQARELRSGMRDEPNCAVCVHPSHAGRGVCGAEGDHWSLGCPCVEGAPRGMTS